MNIVEGLRGTLAAASLGVVLAGCSAEDFYQPPVETPVVASRGTSTPDLDPQIEESRSEVLQMWLDMLDSPQDKLTMSITKYPDWMNSALQKKTWSGSSQKPLISEWDMIRPKSDGLSVVRFSGQVFINDAFVKTETIKPTEAEQSQGITKKFNTRVVFKRTYRALIEDSPVFQDRKLLDEWEKSPLVLPFPTLSREEQENWEVDYSLQKNFLNKSYTQPATFGGSDQAILKGAYLPTNALSFAITYCTQNRTDSCRRVLVSEQPSKM